MADYSTSKWARKERSLSEDELSAIDRHGLYNLRDFLPARPTADHYTVISEMFAASVDGELYDPVRWGNFYKPYGVEVPANAATTGLQTTTAPAQQPAAKPAATTPVQNDVEAPPFEADAPAAPVAESKPAATEDAPKKSADDILAMIRNRNPS